MVRSGATTDGAIHVRYSESGPANVGEQTNIPVATSDRQQQLKDAVHHMAAALELLDANGAPAQIGARLDHAMQELTEHLGLSSV